MKYRNWKKNLIKLEKYKTIFLWAFIIWIIIDIYIVKTLDTFVFFLMLVLQAIVATTFKVNHKVFSILGIGILITIPLWIIANHLSIAEKSAIWAYTFFTFSVILNLVQNKSE